MLVPVCLRRKQTLSPVVAPVLLRQDGALRRCTVGGGPFFRLARRTIACIGLVPASARDRAATTPEDNGAGSLF